MHPDRDVADAVVGLGVLAHAERGRVEVRRIDARLADQRVGVDPELLDDLVLQQPVDDDHVRPEQLLPAGDLLEDRLPWWTTNLRSRSGMRTQALHSQDVAWRTSRRRRRKPK